MSNVIDFKENCKVMIDRKTTELVTKPVPEEPKDNKDNKDKDNKDKDNKDKIIEDLINKVKDLEYRIEELEEKFW